MRIRTLLPLALLLPGLLLVGAGCAADKDAFYPETASAEPLLERRALERVPAGYAPESATVIKQWGPLGTGGDTEIVGYNVWIRVKGCGGHVLVRFNRWGDHRATADMTDCG